MPTREEIQKKIDDDFLFVLEPHTRYWFVTSVDKWMTYRKIMKAAFGKDGFRTIMTEERRGHELESGKKVHAVWVVIEVGDKPILTSADIMGLPTEYYPGDTPYNTGAYEETGGGWVINVVGAWWDSKAQAVEDWKDGIVEDVSTFGEETAKRAEKVAEQFKRGTERLVLGLFLGGLGLYAASRALDR